MTQTKNGKDTVVKDSPLTEAKKRLQADTAELEIVSGLHAPQVDMTTGISEVRPWGSFTVLEIGTGYKIKRIEVNPGHRLSLQMHHHRSEHWIVVSGTARVSCNNEEKLLTSNQSTYVPPCSFHRLENPGVVPLVLIEVQNGEYLGEDDIVRIQDDYNRANG